MPGAKSERVTPLEVLGQPVEQVGDWVGQLIYVALVIAVGVYTLRVGWPLVCSLIAAGLRARAQYHLDRADRLDRGA